MKRGLLLIILTIKSFCSIGQNSHEEFFSQLANQFCDCALKVKDKNEFEICGNIVKSVDSIQLTEADKTYLFDKLKKQCGEVFTKYWGPQRPRIPSCSFLQEVDLKDFNLQKFGADKVSVHWTSDKEREIVREVIDYRRQFTSDSLAINYLDTQKKLTISDDFKTTTFSNKIFQSLEVISFDAFGNFHVYQIYARRDTLIYFLTITLSKEDLQTIEQLIDRLSDRVKKCN